MKREVDVLGSPSLRVRTVSVDVKQQAALNERPGSWEPRSCGNKEVEPGSHVVCWTVFCFEQLFSIVGSLCVFVSHNC